MSLDKQTILFRLEQDIANFLCDAVESANMTPERAALIARFILVQLPSHLSDEQLEMILPSLDDEFVELAKIIAKYMSEYERKYEEKLTVDVQMLVRYGRLDEASLLMRAYFNKKLTT